ncbi:deoxynucleoside kinase [Micromonospora deserti]|uniref:deoxynucleoside kinase n=1 Tax=Micromonospora deserti TaxID=2070366 RepID=UPI001F3B4B16|nr:deoxynucleoside kinase [Micromonospora deserti]
MVYQQNVARWSASRYAFGARSGTAGVDKTTLAGRLAARLDATLMLDPFADNPYLPQLYAEAEHATDDLALKVELTFIALRVAQLRRIKMITRTGGRIVADWAMVQQRIFAAERCPPPTRAVSRRPAVSGPPSVRARTWRSG